MQSHPHGHQAGEHPPESGRDLSPEACSQHQAAAVTRSSSSSSSQQQQQLRFGANPLSNCFDSINFENQKLFWVFLFVLFGVALVEGRSLVSFSFFSLSASEQRLERKAGVGL